MTLRKRQEAAQPEAAPKRAGRLRPVFPCRWDLSPAEARAEQEILRHRVRVTRLRWRGLERIAGCDVAVRGDRLFAAVVVLRLADLKVLETARAEGPLRFPYVPGLLSFREVPILCRAFERLTVIPQAVLCDGQGRAHPRRIGLASHLGILLDLPTVGCAKSRLIGEGEEPPLERSAWNPLVDDGERIGAVLRTRDGVKPLFISTGHRTTLPDAVRLVLACGAGFRLPEPTRLADQEVRRMAARSGFHGVTRFSVIRARKTRCLTESAPGRRAGARWNRAPRVHPDFPGLRDRPGATR